MGVIAAVTHKDPDEIFWKMPLEQVWAYQHFYYVQHNYVTQPMGSEKTLDALIRRA